MDVKKKFGSNLEKKKKSFLTIGLLFSLAIVLAAFEYRTFPENIQVLGKFDPDLIEEEVIPVSLPAPPPPPPPPAPTTRIEIVEDDVAIEDELEIVDIEVELDSKIDEVLPEELEELIVEDEIFPIVENMPEFPGGEKELFIYLGKNIKYPPMAKDVGIKGKVYVTFVVDKNGSITDVSVLHGIGGGCDEEAIRVVKAMPKWSPGKQRGKAVKVQFNLPVNFILK